MHYYKGYYDNKLRNQNYEDNNDAYTIIISLTKVITFTTIITRVIGYNVGN